jgi:hypothetical protein
MNAQFSAAELARRRAASRRLGWALGAVVLALYLLGFFIQR